MATGTQIVDAPKAEGYVFVFRPPMRLSIFMYRIASPLFCLGFYIFVVWPDYTSTPRIFAAQSLFVALCALGGVVCVRQGLSFWSGDESFRCTYRVTSERIVKEYPSRRIEAGKASELKAIEGGGRTTERWWLAFRNPPVVLHFESGEKLTLVPRIRVTHWAGYSDYHLLLDKLGRLWQGNPIVDEWTSRHRKQTYNRHYVFINLFGSIALVVCLLFAAEGSTFGLPVTLGTVVGIWITMLVYAFFWIRRDQRKANDI